MNEKTWKVNVEEVLWCQRGWDKESNIPLNPHCPQQTISSGPALSFDLATKDISPQLFYCFELKTVDCHPEILASGHPSHISNDRSNTFQTFLPTLLKDWNGNWITVWALPKDHIGEFEKVLAEDKDRLVHQLSSFVFPNCNQQVYF